MTNFDFLKNEPKFKDFADVAISAERIFQFDYAASVLNCRRAMEFAVKWMYSVDSALVMPWDDRLVSLMSTDEFRDIIDADLLKRMEFIRKTGNFAAHTGQKVKKEQAELRQEYLAAVRQNLKAQLNNIDIKEKDGSVTNLNHLFL